jgi:sugar phosphate isomerase/epimerase
MDMNGLNENIAAGYLYIITRHGYPPDPAGTLSHLDEFSALGFRSVELEGIREGHLEHIHEMREQIRQRADELGLKIPVFCDVLPGLGSPDGAERERNLALFEKGCETAAALGAGAVMDNAPIPPWKFPNGIPMIRHFDGEALERATLPADLDWDRYWDGLVETFRHACDTAAGHGLTFHLHPCLGSLVGSADAFLLFAGAVKRDNLRFNMDTANQFFMKDNLVLSLLRLKGLVDYIHISDNRGDRMEHLGIGRGRINWNEFLEALDRTGYDGMFGVDVGGAESEVNDLDGAYRGTARWLQDQWFERKQPVK